MASLNDVPLDLYKIISGQLPRPDIDPTYFAMDCLHLFGNKLLLRQVKIISLTETIDFDSRLVSIEPQTPWGKEMHGVH